MGINERTRLMLRRVLSPEERQDTCILSFKGGASQVEELEVIQPQIPKVKIEIEKGQKGTYAWSVRVYSDSVENALSQVKEADLKLREEYGGL